MATVTSDIAAAPAAPSSDARVIAATVDALMAASAPFVAWIVVGALSAAMPGLLADVPAEGGYLERLLAYSVITLAGGVFSGLILVFAAVVVMLFAATYVRRYSALGRARSESGGFRPLADEDAAGLPGASRTRRSSLAPSTR